MYFFVESFVINVVNFVGILQSTSFGLTLQQLLRSTAIINNLERYKDIFECILHGIFKEIGNEDELKSLIDPILENIEQPRFLQITVVIANIINEVGTYDKKNLFQIVVNITFTEEEGEKLKIRGGGNRNDIIQNITPRYE